MIKSIAATAGVLLLSLAQGASADIIGTVTFTNPVVSVTSTDSIPVYLTLTLDPNSDPLITDGSASVTSLTSSQINNDLFAVDPAFDMNGNPASVDTSADLLDTNTNTALGCSGTFFQGCGGAGNGGPYDFNFYFGPGGFIAEPGLNLLPGSSTQILFGTFTPEGGNAPAGTYNLPYASLFIQVFDESLFDQNGNPLDLHIADIPLGDTSASAGFTAIVTAPAPEPSFYGIGASILLSLCLFARHRLQKI